MCLSVFIDFMQCLHCVYDAYVFQRNCVNAVFIDFTHCLLRVYGFGTIPWMPISYAGVVFMCLQCVYVVFVYFTYCSSCVMTDTWAMKPRMLESPYATNSWAEDIFAS